MLASAHGSGPYVLQATIARCHADADPQRRPTGRGIVSLYDELLVGVAVSDRLVQPGDRDRDARRARRRASLLLDDIPASSWGSVSCRSPKPICYVAPAASRRPQRPTAKAIPLAATDADRALLERRLADFPSRNVVVGGTVPAMVSVDEIRRWPLPEVTEGERHGTAPGSWPARRSHGNDRSARRTSNGSVTRPRRPGPILAVRVEDLETRRPCSPHAGLASSRSRTSTATRGSDPAEEGHQACRCETRSSTAGWPARPSHT